MPIERRCTWHNALSSFAQCLGQKRGLGALPETLMVHLAQRFPVSGALGTTDGALSTTFNIDAGLQDGFNTHYPVSVSASLHSATDDGAIFPFGYPGKNSVPGG